MPKQLVPQTHDVFDEYQKKPKEKLEFVEKEIDMGFFDNHYFQVKDGVVINNSCQRINKCSCNCNHCSWGVL